MNSDSITGEREMGEEGKDEGEGEIEVERERLRGATK